MHISKIQWFYMVIAFIIGFYFLKEVFRDIVLGFGLSLIGAVIAIIIVNLIEKPK